MTTGVVGCDQSPPPPPAKGGQGGLSGLSETPSSSLGKSAALGRNTARSVEQNQAQAAGMADEVSGQATVVKVAGLEFRAPSAWEKTATANKIQAAQLRVAASTGQGETLCVFFDVIGGSVADNINRWKGQVKRDDSNMPADAEEKVRTILGMKAHFVSMTGTYMGMAAGTQTAQPGFGFRGVLIETPKGNMSVRLTGPSAEVEAAEAAWESMILGVRKP